MLRRLAPMVAVALAIAGCGTAPTDPPPPGTATSTTTSGTTINLGSVYEHPCATLTSAQQHQLSLPPQVRESAGDSTGMCKWSKDDDSNFFLRFDLRSGALAEAYKRRGERDPNGDLVWKSFEPGEIRGLPAVVRSFSEVGTHCEVIVDAGNGQGISITGSLLTTLDPKLCDRLVTASEWIVDKARA